ncbi:hypothetical protein D3C72_1597400 [compost metagenome]
MAAAHHLAQKYAAPKLAHGLIFRQFLERLAGHVLVGQDHLNDLGGQIDDVSVFYFAADDAAGLQDQRIVAPGHAQHVAGLQHGAGVVIDDLIAAANAFDKDTRVNKACFKVANCLAHEFGVVQFVGTRGEFPVAGQLHGIAAAGHLGFVFLAFFDDVHAHQLGA